jgi:tetratricopeptide (TPR) repeat protein
VAHVRLVFVLAAGSFAVPPGLAAQADQIAAGVHAADLHDFLAATSHFEAALRHDPSSYEANWRLALVLIDVAKQTPDRLKSSARDSLYLQAESYARHAVAAKPDGAEGHFAVANAIGRGSLSMSAREKVRRATEVRAEALRAIELDPHHDGAWHILGRWNAEVERLPSLERFFARTFLGGAVFGTASWDEAERDLRLAVQYAPTRIVHRFDLAEILVSRKEWAAARQQLEMVASLPSVDVSDTSYKRQARELMPKVMEKLGK